MKCFSLKSSLVALAAASFLSTVVVVGQSAQPAKAANKITICHRTHSTTNPYRRITVSTSSVNRNNGHSDHIGGPFDATFAYPSNAKNWGDIIPDASAGGANNLALNFTGRGLAIYNGSSTNLNSSGATVNYAGKCGSMSAKQFYDVELAAGQTAANIIADLNNMDANEDAPLKSALGGSFSTGSVATWDATVAVTTLDATNTGLSSNNTLNGTLKYGSGTVVKAYFQWSTTNSFTASSPSLVAASPVSITGNGSAQSVSLNLGNKSAGTYYFRVIGIVNEGTDLEGILYGDVKSFTLAAAGTPVITTDSLSQGTAGTAYSATVVAANGTSPYSFSLVSATCLTGSGLTLATNGIITGANPVKGLYTCDYVATDSAGSPQASAAKTLSIRIKKNPSINIPDPGSKTFGDPSFSAGASNDVTPDEVSESGSVEFNGTTGVCDVDGAGAITIVGAGTCTITASHSGNGFFFNGSNSRSFTVAKKNQNVTLNPADKDLDDATVDMSATSDATGSGTVTYSGGTPGVCSVASNGRVTLIGAGTCSVTATHPGNGNFNDGTRTSTFTVRPRPSNNSNNSSSSTSSTTSTTTSPTTSTTTAPAVSRGASATGALKGTAWIDMNRNGRREQREPLLANQLIEVSRATATAASARGIVRKQASYTTKTDLNGSYSIPELEPGTWTVKATLTAKELEKTFDSTGAADWSATAVVPTNGVGRADFAAAGTEKLEITVQAQVAAGSTVIVHWAGSDGKFCSGDDIEFEATVVNGKVNLDGVPAGEYKVGEKPVCTFTQTVSPAGVPVIAAKATDTADVATSATVSRATPVTRVTYRPTATLPATGSQPMRIVSWALLALLLGSLFVSAPSFTTVLRRSVSRRRR